MLGKNQVKNEKKYQKTRAKFNQHESALTFALISQIDKKQFVA